MTVGPMLLLWEYEFSEHDSSPQLADSDPAQDPPYGKFLP
jgi:hypothetical protein